MPRTDPQSLRRRLQEWAARPGNERWFRRGQEQLIGSALNDPRRTMQLAIGAILLGTWHLGSGQARVLAGAAGGWDDVRLGVALQRTGLLLRGRAKLQRTPRGDVPGLPVLQTANCAALCLSLDDPDAGPLLAAFAALPDACFGARAEWPRFVRELLRVRDGRRPTNLAHLGPYADVLRHWQGDLALLARRLCTVLDLHLDRTQGAPGRPADFEEPGVLLFPVEVLAVRAVRAALGLSTPKVEHPLMYTNLATMQPHGPWPRDELLARLVDRLREPGRGGR